MSSNSDLEPSIEVLIYDRPIDVETIRRQIHDENCGSEVIFIGSTRKITNGLVTRSLSYVAYLPMAQNELQKLAHYAAEKWLLRHVIIHHRIGEVHIGQPSVVVAVSSPHRTPSMEAVPWLMDQLKSKVPIWKQETFENDDTKWVHPTA